MSRDALYGAEPGQPVSETTKFRAMQNVLDIHQPISWNKAWEAEITPFDAGEFQPPLQEFIEVNVDKISWPRGTGRALVPGCGLGYDVVYLASALGLHVVGLEMSEIARNKANAYIAGKSLGKGTAATGFGDFFKYLPNEGYDLIYDYTFFVAIPPSRRSEWAAKMAELTKPGGYLITLVFPIDPKTDVGPPFYVRPEHYEELLSSNFEKVVGRVPETSLEGHKGRERMLIWRRKAA